MVGYELAVSMLSSMVASSVLAAFLLWLTKTWIASRLQSAIRSEYDAKLATLKAQLQASNDTQLERLKSQLKAQSDVELEKLKSSLSVAASERNTTFARLHDKRFEVIAEIYKRLQQLHASVAEYTKDFEFEGERRADRYMNVAAVYDDFHPYFLDNQIFLPRELAKTVGIVKQDLKALTNRFRIMVQEKEGSVQHEWIRILERLEGEVQSTLGALEEAMRVALGDRSSSAASADV